MAEFNFHSLEEKYGNFKRPMAVVRVREKDFAQNKYGLALTDIEIDLTSGFEAAAASFRIYNAFDETASEYLWERVKSYALLGAPVSIGLGYEGVFETVFSGYIARVNFVFEEMDAPNIKVTALDVKGIMMAGSYAKQIKAADYGKAVEQILHKSAYQGIVTDIRVDRTPDQEEQQGEQKASAATIEMVGESDYEFVVKAAQKFNFEFFTEVGTVYFRRAKARDRNDLLIELGPETGIHAIDVEYDMTGLVHEIEVRGMDVGKAKAVSARKKYTKKISGGSLAASLLNESEKIYIDPTAVSAKMAGYRAQSLLETMSYRFGSLYCETIGLPELVPGRFIRLIHLGRPVENIFYLTRVRHIISNEKGFYTKVEGKADSLQNQ